MDAPVSLHSLDELRQHVLRTLCAQENLIVEQFSLQETVLMRRGVCCGRQFALFGPRSVRLGAVWAADRNDLYYYDARGERYRKERITGSITSLNSEAA